MNVNKGNNQLKLIRLDEPVSLYIHIPFCRDKCFYCGFYSENISGQDVGATLNAMKKELGRYHFSAAPSTIYIGGGSPSAIEHSLLIDLIEHINSNAGRGAEFTVEVNPCQADKKFLKDLRIAGVNRISIGAQSLSSKDLQFLKRQYSSKTVEKVVSNAAKAGFENISIDLIFAIPGSNIQRWRRVLRRAVSINPQHISAYSLSYETETVLRARRDSGKVKSLSEDVERKMYDLAIRELTHAGYRQYEISNFARPGMECSANLTYWNNDEYIGIGPGATSFLQGERRTNVANINKYRRQIELGADTAEEVFRNDRRNYACETAVLNLRKIRGINLARFARRTGYDALVMFAGPIERYEKMGLIHVTNTHIRLRRKALPIADSILCDFASVD